MIIDDVPLTRQCCIVNAGFALHVSLSRSCRQDHTQQAEHAFIRLHGHFSKWKPGQADMITCWNHILREVLQPKLSQIVYRDSSVAIHTA